MLKHNFFLVVSFRSILEKKYIKHNSSLCLLWYLLTYHYLPSSSQRPRVFNTTKRYPQNTEVKDNVKVVWDLVNQTKKYTQLSLSKIWWWQLTDEMKICTYNWWLIFLKKITTKYPQFLKRTIHRLAIKPSSLYLYIKPQETVYIKWYSQSHTNKRLYYIRNVVLKLNCAF